ncbi:DUF6054 family protein [Bacillus niameyensis]|uniref:DUF6054 family protein n=1 Tax=Bacillus niameyensis TaxID=1522308 RepID=UPI0007810D1C|nr:DUF6054 family protein [Bacillus niameyensis]
MVEKETEVNEQSYYIEKINYGGGDGVIMAKYEKTIIGQFEKVINRLESDIGNSGISMRLVDESNYTIGDTKIAVRVYDKYFMN